MGGTYVPGTMAAPKRQLSSGVARRKVPVTWTSDAPPTGPEAGSRPVILGSKVKVKGTDDSEKSRPPLIDTLRATVPSSGVSAV